MRDRIGHDLLLLPGVTAVIRDGARFLLARQRDSERWSLVGGGVEPFEDPIDAVRRAVEEELGVVPVVGRVIGAYGGEALASTYPNGDRVSYVTTAFECGLPPTAFELEAAELIETAWFTRDETLLLTRHEWIDRVLSDAERRR